MATYPIKMLRDEDKQPFVPFTNAAAVVDKNNESLQELMDNGKYKIVNNTTTSSAGQGVLDAYQGKILNDKFDKYVPLTQKGAANGVATLDGEGKVPSSQLPSYVDDVIESYIVDGSTALSAGWLSATNGGAALTPEKGKIYLVMTAGQYQNHQYRWGGSTYVLCNPSDVNSVNGMTGVVVLKKLTIQRNGTQVGDTFNGTTDEVININVPTNNNQLTNGAGYITSAGSITGNAATATNADTANIATKVSLPRVTDDANTNYGRNLMIFKEYASTCANLPSTHWYHIFTGESQDDHYATQLAQSMTTDGLYYRRYAGGSWVNWSRVYSTTYKPTKADVGLGNVDNTADANKSVLKATQDGNGKVIANTYLPLAGGTMTGPITLKGLVAQQISEYDANLLKDGIFHTFSDSNTQTITGLPIQSSMGIIAITPYINGSDNRTVQLALSSNGAMYYRTLRNGNTKWNEVVTAANSQNFKSGGTKAALTIQKNGTTVDSSFDGSVARTINITVPTKVTDLTDNTNYTKKTDYASASSAGVIKLGTGLTAKDGVVSVTGSATADSVEWAAVKNAPTKVSYWTNDSGYITLGNVMAGATASTAGKAGVVPAPGTGSQAKFLRGDGQWADVSYATSAGNATTASNADKLDNFHESSFLRARNQASGDGGASHTNTLWSQIGIMQYSNALPDGLGDSATYTYGATVSLPGGASRFDLWYSHQTSSNGDGLRYRTGWNDDKRPWAILLDNINCSKYTIKVTRGASVPTNTTGYWAAMCNTANSSNTTLPSTNQWWHVISTDWSSDTTNWVSQLALPTQQGGVPHYRRNNAANTAINSSTWHKFITDENIASQSVSNAGYIRSSGRLTSATTSNRAPGLRYYEIYNNGYPITYGNVLQVNGINGVGQLAMQWHGTELYYRSAPDTSTTYTSWARILSSNNYNSYALPLTGGTMTGTITSSVATGTHINGNRGVAIINSTASGTSYNILCKMNSTNGYWTMGSWGTKYCLFYTAKSVVDAGTNGITRQVTLLDEAGNAAFPGIVSAAGGFKGSLNGNAATATAASKVTQGSSSSSVADNQLVFWIES